MKIRLLRRPTTGIDEFPASLVNRALRANGYAMSRANRDVITAAVVENPANGYVDIIKSQKLCAAMMFSRRPKKPDETWIAGAICTACIREGNKLSLVAAHPDVAVCVRHKLKLHAYCPNCRTPTSSTWLEHQRCDTCRTPISRFPKILCSEAEACTAIAVQAWLSGTHDAPATDILNGLWSVPLQQRPSVLRALVSTAFPRPKDPSYAEQQRYLAACRDWLLRNAADWRAGLITALAKRYPAPPKAAGFAAACRWLGRALNQGEPVSSWPIPIPAGSFVLLPALLGADFLSLVDRTRKLSFDPGIQIRTPGPSPIGRANRIRRTCQWSLRLPGSYLPEPTVIPLQLLNLAKPFWPRRQSATAPVPWRQRPKRFLFRARQQTMDVFELTLRRLIAGIREASERFMSLNELKFVLSTREFAAAETALLNQELRCYLINKTGNYRDDIGVCRDALAAWLTQQGGGQYVLPFCA